MKKATLYDWMIFMALATVCVILIFNVIAIFVLKIPTTPDNQAIRMKLIDLLNNMQGAALTAIGFKAKEKMENQNKL